MVTFGDAASQKAQTSTLHLLKRAVFWVYIYIKKTASSTDSNSQSHCQSYSVLFDVELMCFIFEDLPCNPTFFSCFNGVKYQEGGLLAKKDR